MAPTRAGERFQLSVRSEKLFALENECPEWGLDVLLCCEGQLITVQDPCKRTGGHTVDVPC